MGSEQWAAGASNYPSLGCLTFCDHQVVTKLSATKDRYLDVNYHIKKIFESLELLPEATIRKFRIVQQEGGRQVTRSVEHYNLQMIIAVLSTTAVLGHYFGIVNSGEMWIMPLYA